MTIAEFLLKLASDSALRQRFSEDRESVIREYELGPQATALLRSGDLRELHVKIKAEFEVDGERVAFLTVYGVPPVTVYEPDPDPDPDSPPPDGE
jgi:hypothetical protein